MNWKTVELMAKSLSSAQAENPPVQIQFYYTLKETANYLGRDIAQVRVFLVEHSVPYYRIGKTKSYLLPEVIEAVNKTRWRDPS
jgi:hypothetical protein